jgi:hypothetical protein
MENKQPFENYPGLARHIARMATTGYTGSPIMWNAFLQDLNEVLTELEQEIMMEEGKNWGAKNEDQITQ